MEVTGHVVLAYKILGRLTQEDQKFEDILGNLVRVLFKNKRAVDKNNSSAIVHLPSMCEALGSIPSTEK